MLPAQSGWGRLCRGLPRPYDGSFDEDAFLLYNIENLRRIARDDNAPGHQWLVGYLERCKENPLRRELKRYALRK